MLRFPLICLVALTGLGWASAIAEAATPLHPDLKTLAPRDLRFDRADVSVAGTGDFHNVLRFSNTVWNGGAGKLELRAQINQSTGDGAAVERVYDTSGNFVDYPAGRMYYHAAHQHYHYDNWGAYQLWTKSAYDTWIASGRSIGQAYLVGTKTTSCVMDEEFVTTLSATQFPAVFPSTGCYPNSQNLIVEGISPGWGDTYDYYRFEQWIDLGQQNLPDGQYVLRSVTDPLNNVYESPNKSDSSRESEQVNEAVTPFTVQGGNLVDVTPPSGSVSINDVDAQTSSPNVTVKVIGRDDVSGVNQFRLSNDGNQWRTYSYTQSGSSAQSVAWDLSNPTYGGNSASGTHTVYAQFHDASGKWSTSVTDSIVWDSGSSVPSSYSAAVLADGPVGYWRLGETSGTTAADSAGANRGTYTNGPTLGSASLLVSDTANRSVTLDGVNDYVRVPDSVSLSPTARVSVEAWIKPAALPAAGSFASVASKPEAYSLQFNGPRLEFTIMQSGARKRLQAPAGTIATGSTYHVVGTYDGATSRLYVNGAQVASMALTGGVSTTTNVLAIGSWGGGAEFLRGTVDDVAVYNSALSAARVKAHFDAGSGPPPNPLGAPSNLSATAVSGSRIDLSWTDNASNETGFTVERDTSSSFASPVTATVGANVTTHSDTGLTPGTKYYYRVKATNATDTSGYSNASSATTPNPVAAPRGLSATAVSSSRVDLSWTDNASNETGYTVERDTNSSFTSPASFTAAPNSTSYQDLGLTPGVKYYYRVKGFNPTDASAYSNTSSATTPNPVAAPSGLSATAVSSSRVDLSWTDNSPNETSFAVERDTNSAFSSPTSATVGANTTSYSDTGLSPSTTYYYRVKGVNATDASGYSNTVNATTAAGPPPASYAPAVLADSPVSYWRLGEASGTVAADERSANAGTYVNGPALGSASLLGSDATNTAVGFDGVNDHVRVASSASLNIASPVSLEAWIKPAAIPVAGSFASVVTKAEAYSLQFNGPRLEFTIMQSGVRRRLQAPAGAIVAGQTYDVAGTYDGTTQRLYVNGAQVASGALTGGASSSANGLFIGSWTGSSEFFKGTIDEVAVYSSALSAARVSAHYDAGR